MVENDWDDADDGVEELDLTRRKDTRVAIVGVGSGITASHILRTFDEDGVILLPEPNIGVEAPPIPIRNTHLELPNLEIARAYFGEPKPVPPWRKRRQRRR